jgi:predicted PurR-regulated permease PerM
MPPLGFFRAERGEPHLRRQWLTYRAFVLGVSALFVLGLGYLLSEVLNPFLIALLIAYVLNPLVERLEQRGIQRRFAVYVLFAGALLLIGGSIGFGAFNAGEQIEEIRWELQGERLLDERDSGDKARLDALQKAADAALRRDPQGRWFVDVDGSGDRKIGLIEGITATIAPVGSRISTDRLESFARALETQAGDALAVGAQASKGLSEFLKQLTNFVGYVFLVPLYTFFLLLTFSSMRDAIRSHLPGAYREHIVVIAHRLDEQLSAFFRGRLVLALTKGALTALGLAILGVRFAFFIGMLAGLLSVVPLLGPLVGAFLAVLFCYDSSGNWGARCAGVGAVFAATETFEALAYPAVIGRNVGLHPLALILALFSFGKLLGLFGVLMAVPIACCLKILFEEFVLPEVRALAQEKPAPPS